MWALPRLQPGQWYGWWSPEAATLYGTAWWSTVDGRRVEICLATQSKVYPFGPTTDGWMRAVVTDAEPATKGSYGSRLGRLFVRIRERRRLPANKEV